MKNFWYSFNLKNNLALMTDGDQIHFFHIHKMYDCVVSFPSSSKPFLLRLIVNIIYISRDWISLSSPSLTKCKYMSKTQLNFEDLIYLFVCSFFIVAATDFIFCLVLYLFLTLLFHIILRWHIPYLEHNQQRKKIGPICYDPFYWFE